MNINGDIDPLSNYEYQYNDYNSHPMNPYANIYPVKQEQPMLDTDYLHHFMDPNYRNNINYMNNLPQYTDQPYNANNGNINNGIQKENNDQVESTKEEDVKPIIDPMKIKKERGRKSSYFSVKIADNDFKFYGCSVCNVSFSVLHELDQHVTVHKDRITSYDLKIKNQIRRKNLKKEQKKKKKSTKNVKIESTLKIEIKPEDGYIGNEKASEFNENNEKLPEINEMKEVINNEKVSEFNKCNEVNISEKASESNENNEVKTNNIGNRSELDNSTMADNSTLNGNSVNGESDEGNVGNGNSANIDNDSKSGVKDSLADKSKVLMQTETDVTNLAKIYKCFACQKQFTLSYYLKLHVRSHTDEKPYTCNVCGQSFITASKLGRHNKRMHLSVRYQCRICYRYYSKFECLTRHFDKKHPDDKLEGEPYDYNAILPYLKELEEQLREKAEEAKQAKTEDLWGDWPAPMDSVEGGDEKPLEVMVDQKPLEIIVEGDMPHVVQIKKEEPDFLPESCDENVKSERDGDNEETENQGLNDSTDFHSESFEDVKNDSLKEEDGNVSDDNYFPDNTWVPPTPKVEIDESPTKRKKSNNLQCEICNKKISTITYMRVHMRTHTGERPFSCYLCGRGFITSSKLHRHVLTHEEMWEGGIEGAKKEDDVKSEAEDEKTEKEEGDPGEKEEKKDVKVDKKDKIKKAKADFAAKTKKESKRCKRWQHTCEFCHRKFLHAETLAVHKKSHEGEELVYKCHYCLLPLPDAAAVTSHESSHSGLKPYTCLDCGKSYRRREAMIYHKKQHKPDQLFYCEICLKSFNAQCKLQRHIQSHREKKYVLKYECPVCAHMFHTKYHIQMHLATHQKEGLIKEKNRNEILAMVLQNARKFPKQPDMMADTPVPDPVPDEDRSRICNICGEIFQHFYFLEEHLKSHGSKIALEDLNSEEEKKHICTVCNKGFKLHYYLKLHSFTHTKEKPFICQQCGKGFITRGKLKRHLETHTGVKKYQCHICCKFFTRSSYLRIHVRTIHGTQDYNSSLGKGYIDSDMGEF